MRTRNLFLTLIFLSLFLTSFIQADDSCPSGMRKTYVDDTNMLSYGSARKWLAAVCFFQFPGSLFYNRKMLIEPRFEIHLKASVDAIDIVENSGEQKIYGFTMVISGYKNTISGLEGRTVSGGGTSSSLTFTDIGYNNFVNALIVEFDFVQDYYDPDSSSYSIRYCDTYCHSYDYYAMVSKSLSQQRYNPGYKNDWDFKLVYTDKTLYLYSGPNTVLYSMTYDLEKTLGTNIAFVGFTGFMESNRGEISIIGTFACEDNYEISKMTGAFYENGKEYSEKTYEPGQTINYAFKFIDNQGNYVPHTYGYDIWDYSFFITQDCDTKGSYSITKVDNYTLLFTVPACTKVGQHWIKINEELKGSAPSNYYTVVPGPLQKITLVGHDGIIGDVPLKTDTDSYFLNFGDGNSGDFTFKYDLNIILDFNIADQYGNKVSVTNPASLFSLKQLNDDGTTSNVNEKILKYSLEENGNYYQMTLTVNQTGTYIIEKNDYMEKPIKFKVIPGEPSGTQSYCSLDIYTSIPTLKLGSDLNYKCILRDSYGNDVSIKSFIQNSKYEFYCSVDKTWPSTASYSPIVTYDENMLTNYYDCSYTGNQLGNFAFNGYLRLKTTKQLIKITSKINQFYIRGYASNYIIKKIYNPSTTEWMDIDTAENTKIKFVSDSSGLVTALDFAEADGSILISQYVNFPEDFKLDDLTAILTSPHDNTFDFVQPTVKELSMGGRSYVGIYLYDEKKTGKVIVKSSFEYYLNFNYLDKQKKSAAVQRIPNIGSYVTCFHPLDLQKTKVTISESLELVIGVDEYKIGQIILQTDDSNLYNYDIGEKNITYRFEDNKNIDIKFRFVALSIEGTYDVYVTPNQEYHGKIEILVLNVVVYTISAASDPAQACYIKWSDENSFKYISQSGKEIYYEYTGKFADGNLLINFQLLDKYNKVIDNKEYYTTYSDISSEEYGTDEKYFTINYDESKSLFEFRDNIPYENRQRGWVFTTRERTCNYKYYVRYDGKNGGSPLSPDNSYFVLLNDKININNDAYVEVIYKDKNNQLLGLQEGKLNDLKDITNVYAYKDGKNAVTLQYESTTSNYALRYKATFTNSGEFTIKTTYNGAELKYQNSNKLTVIDNIYSLLHSNLKMIIDSIIDLYTDVLVTIDNTLYEPIFKLYFYTKEDKKTTYDKNINFQLTIPVDTSEGYDTISFKAKTDNDYYVEFNFKNEDDLGYFKRLKRGNYNLKLTDGKETMNYPIFLNSDNNTDYSNERNYDISKTEVKPTTIEGIAGKTYSINVEFRAVDGLRWNGNIELDSFILDYNKDYLDSFSYNIEKGPKKGQVVIFVTQTKVTNENPNILSFTYKNDKIPKEVTLTIKCADLTKLVLNEGPTSGDVRDPPKLIFIPEDSYGNLYTDLFTSSYTQEELNGLTVGKSKDNIGITPNNVLTDGKYLTVQYMSTVSTDVIVTSDYFENSYEYRIWSGPIDKDKSYAEIKSSTTEVGGEYILLISPKDLYNNNVDGLIDNDIKDFNIVYKEVVGTFEFVVESKYCKLIERSSNDDLRILSQDDRVITNFTNIECKVNITKAGMLQFVVKYIEDIILCKNLCHFLVVPTDLYFPNTETYYTNKNTKLTIEGPNIVEIGTTPNFEVYFYDEYKNQLEAILVNNIDISAKLEGTDVKLCVSNNGKTKLITICPTSNGDDNENKWKYLTNGDNYRLTIQDNNFIENVIEYKITLTGGATDGSSDDIYLYETYISNTSLNLIAGEEDSITMELRTSDKKRKNYWYPEPNENIKIIFESDSDTCTSNVEKADLPGRYFIKITCTKATTFNRFFIYVEGKQLDKEKTVELTVTSGIAYSLEVQNNNKQFTISSDKYTWTNNPSNDDIISFSFIFKDKYQNTIETNLINSAQFTISSETFGSSKTYYNLEFKDGYSYLMTDLINTAITKHTWNIVVVESNRKYSFIYTKIPGVPDFSKSYWTIDKTSYILKETSIVSVYLIDKLGVNLGSQSGRLNTEKSQIKVVANNGKDNSYSYKSLTSTYLKYTYSLQEIGDYNITVTYNGKELGEKKTISVDYQIIDIKTSKLYYNLDNQNDVLMSLSTQTNINNLLTYPFYKFFLYTSDGTKITTYDHNTNITCNMTYGEQSWKLDVEPLDTYLKLTYESGFEEKFKKLPLGLYYIEITLKGDLLRYPLYLLGEKDVSPSNDYDLAKIYIKPIEIEANAGEEKEIEIEFRASDGLRWNYAIILNAFGVSNSYGLKEPKFKYRTVLGEKNGQMKLYITQTVSTTGKDNNILYLSYKSENVPQTISLNIKSSTLKTITYVSGIKDGTVINPPIGKFVPYDEYGNVCTQVFDESEYPKEELEKLTAGGSVDGYPITSNIYTGDGYLYVSYGCTKVTTIKITSEYFTETYTYKLLSGPIDPTYSYAEVLKNEGVIAGDINTINVYPKDIYENDVTSISETDINNFEVKYEIDGGTSVTIMNNCKKVEQEKPYLNCDTNITKAGDVIFGVDYNDKVLKCINCNFTIKPDTLDFSKTIVINLNTNKEMSKTSLNVLTVTTNPVFKLTFYDRFMNAIIDQTEVQKLNVNTEIQITDVLLCVETNYLFKTSSLCKTTETNENIEKWKYIPNGDSYKLLVYNSKDSLTYPVQITGGYNDGSSGPIDITKTYINPTDLTLTAGVEGSVAIELRTKDNVRKNYWYVNVRKYLGVKFSEGVENCDYIISQGAKPGQYLFKFTCTKKIDSFTSTVVVESADVPTKINMKVIPNEPVSSKLYYMDNTEIKQRELKSVSVEDKLQLLNEFYDKYNNLITNIKFDLSILKIKIAPTISVKNYEYSAETVSQNTGKVIITLKSTYAGEHMVLGSLLPLSNYSIIFTHGEACADNSLLEVSKKEAFVGETVKIYITPYDKYFNLIDAKEYETTSPYQVKYTNYGETTKVIMQKHSIEAKDNINVLAYPGEFYVRGTTNFYGYIDTSPIKCVSCRIDIQSKDIDFSKSIVMRYESSKGDYEELKNGATEKNAKEEPIYRLYPRDEYLNTIDTIPDEKLDKYQAKLIAQEQEGIIYELTLNNKGKKSQQYAEFVVNDEEHSYTYTYATLVGGYYTLQFTDGEKILNYNISLLGDGKGGDNGKEDYQKTHINEQNLKFLAGESGYIVLEIRTVNNKRKNYWNYDIKVKSCKENDNTFKAVASKAGLLGVFQVTITTEKANTYPKLETCPLLIYINDTLVQNLNPEMEVSPNTVVLTTILKDYYQTGSDTLLKDGTADSSYSFEVSSFDKYGNLAETLQETIGLKVSLKGEEISKTTSETNVDTGYRKYTVPISKSGTYVVSTSKTGPQGIYLRKEATFLIKPGTIDLTKTVIKEKTTPIQAGNKPVISIVAYDQFENTLDYTSYIDKFTATFIDANNVEFGSTSTYDENSKKVYYTSKNEVTIVGNVKVEVTYDGKEKLDVSNIIIEVIPGDPYPPNSILSRQSNSGEWVQYYNQDSFEIDTTKTLILNMTLYDKYKNYVNMLPADAQVNDVKMTGNKMKEITFTVSKNTGNFDLDFNGNSAYVHIYQHLVKGTYDLTLTVKTSLGESNFKYNMQVTAGDDLHGNGDIDISKCVLSPLTTTFIAGNHETFTLELRTAEGLLYNDDIDINKDLKIYIDTTDNTFKYNVVKAGASYGIYTITIYSEKKGEYSLNTELNNGKIGPVKYKVTPDPIPDKKNTIISSRPNEEVNAGESQYIKFTLYDKYNNLIDKKDDIVQMSYFTLLNEDQPWTYSSLYFESDSDLRISLMANYPPKKMSLNILYNNGESSAYIFLNNVNFTINPSIDYGNTLIISKNKEKIYAGEYLDMWIYTYDKNGKCVDNDDYSSQYKIEVKGPLDSSKQYITTYDVEKTPKKDNSECNNEYQIIINEKEHEYKYAGNYLIKVYAKNTLIAQYNQVCYPLGYNNFNLKYSFNPDAISILDTPSFTISGTDKYGNEVNEALYDNIIISFTQNGEETEFETTKKLETTIGALNYEVSIHIVGEHQLHIYYNDTEIETVNNGKTLPIFKILTGPCYAENNTNFDLSHLNDTVVNIKTYFTFYCYDSFGNKITKGGEKFTVKGTFLDSIPLDDAKVVDNGDGSYNVEFTPTMKGIYLFNILIGKERYGDEVKFELKDFSCSGDKIVCPNKKLCVDDILKCIDPPNNCTRETPFYCKVNDKETCVASQLDCDCPVGFIKCKIMKYCVPEDRKDMCPKFRTVVSQCMKIGMVKNFDGICRESNKGPSQRVCPIGKVLCADLSCRDKYEDCIVTEVFKNGYDNRCIGQQIFDDANLCPSSITCPSENQVVCPNGDCVDNEIYCSGLTQCNENYPYLCQNNVCAESYEYCPQNLACGENKLLCPDNHCRVNC